MNSRCLLGFLNLNYVNTATKCCSGYPLSTFGTVGSQYVCKLSFSLVNYLKKIIFIFNNHLFTITIFQ